MIEHRKVDCFTGERKAARYVPISRGRGRIAAWMIMGDDNSGAAVDRGVGDDLADRQIGPAFISIVTGQMNAARALVDMGDPQMLFGGIGFGETTSEKSSGGLKPVKEQR